MVTIPKIISSGQIDIGSGTVPRFDTSTGVFSQLANLGNVVVNRIQIIQQERDNQFLVEAQTNSSVTWNDQFFERTQAAPADGAGFTRSMMADYDTWLGDQLASAPNEATKQKLSNSLISLRSNLQKKSAVFERERLKQTTLVNLDNMQQSNIKLVYDNPSDYGFYLDQGQSAIEISSLTEPEKRERRDILKQQLDQARATRDVDTDPNGAVKRLGGGKRVVAPQRLVKPINRASNNTGGNVSSNYLTVLNSRESGFDPNAKAKRSSASGPYQFIDSTWLETFGKYGRAFGFDPKSMTKKQILALRFGEENEELNVNMAAQFASDNKNFIEKNIGRSITDGELAIGHFMGIGNGAKFLRIFDKNPNGNAAEIFPQSAAANPTIFYHTKTVKNKKGKNIQVANFNRPKTMQQVYNERTRPYDGAGSGGKVADVYKDMDLNTRLRFQGLAQASVNNLNRQQAQQKSNQYAQLTHDLQVGIQNNTVTPVDIQQAYDNNQLSNNDHISLMRKATTAQAELRTDANFAEIMDQALKGEPGSFAINPTDKKQVASFDRAVKAVGNDGTSLNNRVVTGDLQAVDQLTKLVDSFKIMPPSTVGAMEAAALSDDTTQRAFVYQTIAAINDKSPGVLKNTPNMTDLIKDANHYQALRGFSNEEAIVRIDFVNSVEYKALAKQRGKEANALAADITATVVQAALDPGTFVKANLSPDNNIKDLAIQEYKELFKFHYNNTGDEKAAHILTKKRMNKLWGVSEATGNRVSMYLPPKEHYPPVVGFPGGDFEYLKIDLEQDVGAFAKENGHEVEDIILLSTQDTEDDINGISFGQTSEGGLGEVNTISRSLEPRYSVGYTAIVDGIPTLFISPLPWKADVEKAREIARTGIAIKAEETFAESNERIMIRESNIKFAKVKREGGSMQEFGRDERKVFEEIRRINKESEENKENLKAKMRRLKGEEPIPVEETKETEPNKAEPDDTEITPQEEIELANEEIKNLQDQIDAVESGANPPNQLIINSLKDEINSMKNLIKDLKKGSQ